MGLASVLNTANSGLRVTQSSLDIVARNIANADTPGYTRKVQTVAQNVADVTALGVRELDVVRAVDSFLQTQMRLGLSAYTAADTAHQYLTRVDQMFGAPGAANSLDTLFNKFEEALQQLVASPDSFTVREEVVRSAGALAQNLRQMSHQVQAMRQQAEDSLAQAVDDVNAVLRQLHVVNQQLDGTAAAGAQRADLLDERDRLLNMLAENLDIRVTERDNGTLSIFTSSGNPLLEGGPAQFVFDHQGDINASSAYSSDPDLRGVGTIQIQMPNGYTFDLLQNGAVSSGRIGALIELRDDILTQTQAQLDELAHGMALAFANGQVAGEAVAVGPQQGFDIDTTGLLPGNSITLDITETPPGVQRTVTIVRVDDPSQLPLPGSVTPNPNDTVIGIDFSGSIVDVAAAIDAALGPGFTVSSAGGATLRFLDDGAGTTAIHGVHATVTASAVQGNATHLPLFVDGGATPHIYSASLDGGPQKAGFASRISVNALVKDNDELLVRYDAATPIGDSARPLELLDRLTNATFAFSAESGIGHPFSPFTGTVKSFAQRVVGFQTGQAEVVSRQRNAAEITLTTLQDRFDKQSGVDINEELSQLIVLQNSFAANARVIQAVDDLMKLLLRF